GAAPAPPPATAPAPPASNAAAPAPAPLPIETKFGGFAGTLDDLAARPAAPPPPPTADTPTLGDPNVERVKAEKGVGIKGRSLDEYEGVIVTPVKTYFAARERIFFEIEFPGNYSRWRVLADETPKDFDDLKAKFLDPLGLTAKLPK